MGCGVVQSDICLPTGAGSKSKSSKQNLAFSPEDGAIRFSESSLNFNRSARHIPEDSALQFMASSQEIHICWKKGCSSISKSLNPLQTGRPGKLLLALASSHSWFRAPRDSLPYFTVSQETHYVSTTKPSRLMLFGETVAVYCENRTEHTNTLCG
jgi:hypothetical protein